MKYYLNQLEKLKDSSEYTKTMKLWDSEGNNTNTMDINLESILVIIDFLKKEQDRLKNNKIKEL